MNRLKTIKNRLKFPYFFLTGWGLFWVLTWFFLIAAQQKSLAQENLPPNLANLTFEQMPPSKEGGQINIPPELLEKLNYNPNRTWQPGQYPAEILKLGDFQESFELQELSLARIEKSTGKSLSRTPLSQFNLVSSQKLGDLTRAVPGLANRPLGQVPIVQALLRKKGYNISRVMKQPIGKLTQRYRQLVQLPLNQVDLSKYSVDSIPGLKQAKLGNFKGWGNASLSSVPGLSSVPFGQFPTAPLLGGGVARIDLALAEVENPAVRSISGSYQAGFNVPCSTECAHVELGDNPAVAGKQWISGQFQEVEGGFGALKRMFNGKEPTGRHPFGKGFKVTIWDIDEPSGTIGTAWFFRVCVRYPIDLGCSPYGIGPISAFEYHENDWIFLGRKSVGSFNANLSPFNANLSRLEPQK